MSIHLVSGTFLYSLITFDCETHHYQHAHVTHGNFYASSIRKYFGLVILFDYEAPPRYNWNIVESGGKHHKPLITKQKSMSV